jgi:Ammonium Transporter Family
MPVWREERRERSAPLTLLAWSAGRQVSLMAKLDDPLDAIAVHAWNGTWGVIAPGLFAAKDLIANAYGNIPTTTTPRAYYGAFMGGGGNLLAAQLVEILWIASEWRGNWAAAVSLSVHLCRGSEQAACKKDGMHALEGLLGGKCPRGIQEVVVPLGGTGVRVVSRLAFAWVRVLGSVNSYHF